jgi:hypothetical protein
MREKKFLPLTTKSFQILNFKNWLELQNLKVSRNEFSLESKIVKTILCFNFSTSLFFT